MICYAADLLPESLLDDAADLLFAALPARLLGVTQQLSHCTVKPVLHRVLRASYLIKTIGVS